MKKLPAVIGALLVLGCAGFGVFLFITAGERCGSEPDDAFWQCAPKLAGDPHVREHARLNFDLCASMDSESGGPIVCYDHLDAIYSTHPELSDPKFAAEAAKIWLRDDYP